MMKRLVTIEETENGRWLVTCFEDAHPDFPAETQAFVSWREAEEYAREWLMPEDPACYEPDPDRDYDLEGDAAAEEAYRNILKEEQ